MRRAPVAHVANRAEDTAPPDTAAEDRQTGVGQIAVGRQIGVGLIARGFLVVLVLWGLASALWMARDVLFVTFFAVLVASFLSLFVDPLHRHLGLPRAVAGPLVLLAFVAIAGGLLFIAWPTLATQFATVSRQLPAAIGSAEAWVMQQFQAMFGTFDIAGESVEARVRSRAAQELADLVGGTIPLLNTVLGALTGMLLVIFAGTFLAIDPHTYAHGLLRLVPASKRLHGLAVLEEVGTTLRRWMAAQAFGMLIIGVAATIGFTIIGMPAALALGLIAGLLEFIPYIGPILSFVPAIAIGLTISAEKALAVSGLYLAIQVLESNLVMPLLIKGVVRLPPALTLLFQATMAALFGFLGLLLAVPILAAGKVVVQELYVDEVAEEN